jgi:hypothetical protein
MNKETGGLKERSEAERVGSPQPQCNTQSSDHPQPIESREYLRGHNDAIEAAAKIGGGSYE